jgi:hypothetical protein
VELADAQFLVELDGDGLFMVAEEAGECCGEWFTFLWAGGLAGGFLAFALVERLEWCRPGISSTTCHL